MDLYMQIGVILVMATGFALVAAAYSENLDLGKDTHAALDEYGANYRGDATLNQTTLIVDGRNLEQWVKQKSMSRDVYLMYYDGADQLIAAVEPVGDTLTATYAVSVDVLREEKFVREGAVYDLFSGERKTAVKYESGNNKVLNSYLEKYASHVRTVARNKSAVVYTFPKDDTGEVMYIVTIQ